jgi:hypothetical protein
MPENETPVEPTEPTGTQPEPTQEPTTEDVPLGPGGQKALAAEREARKAAERRLAELEAAEKARREAEMSELERALARAEAAEAEANAIKQAQQEAQWREEVATEFGVPAKVLRGATREELVAHAQELKALIPPTPGAAPAGKQGIEAGVTPDAPPQLTREQLAALTPEERVKAHAEGKLRDLLSPRT